MKISNLLHGKFVDKEGELTSQQKLWFDQLISQMQKNLSNTGFVIPALSSAQIALLDPVSTQNTLVVDRDANELKINLNGVFKVIQTV